MGSPTLPAETTISASFDLIRHDGKFEHMTTSVQKLPYIFFNADRFDLRPMEKKITAIVFSNYHESCILVDWINRRHTLQSGAEIYSVYILVVRLSPDILFLKKSGENQTTAYVYNIKSILYSTLFSLYNTTDVFRE